MNWKLKNPESNLFKSVDHLSNTPSNNNRTGLQDFEQHEEAAIQSNIYIYIYIYGKKDDKNHLKQLLSPKKFCLVKRKRL